MALTPAQRTARYRQRMRDKGYRLVHGRFTKEPPKQSGPPPHGVSRYRSRRWPCKCAECRAEYITERRRTRLGYS